MISIITPVYNVAKYIEQCIESVRQQSFQDWEWILVDDGSTDDSLAILNRYAALDKRLQVIHQKNQGPAAARNAALHRAVGDYITFLDADDWVEEDYLFNIDKVIQEYEPDLVMWNFRRFSNGVYSDGKNPIPDHGFHHEESASHFTLDLIFRIGNQLGQYAPFLWLRAIKASVIRDNHLSFAEDLKRSEDLLFCIELQTHIKSMYVIADKNLIAYRMNHDSISHNYVSDYMTMLDTIYERIVSINTFPEHEKLRERADFMYVYRALFAIDQEIKFQKSAVAAIRKIRAIMNHPRLIGAIHNIGDVGVNYFGRRYQLLKKRNARSLFLLLKIKGK